MNRKLNKIKDSFIDVKNEFENIKGSVSNRTTSLDNHLRQVSNEYRRVEEICQNPVSLIDDIDRQFKRATKLTDVDIAFLFVATAMQVARQYLLTTFPTERPGDKVAANAVKGTTEKSNRRHRYYSPSLEEILTNPVPFDANMGSAEFDALQGFGPLGHRGATVGHDPILGLICGTANIATSTLTNWKWESFHIYSGTYGQAKGVHDIFAHRARTELVFSHTADKLINQGIEGKKIIGASLIKEIVHLKSDVGSKNSLPLPLVSAISPALAGELAKRGFDMANAAVVGRQAAYSCLINTLVALIHSLFFDPSSDMSRRMYEVRTRKILSYSNIIASTSNIIVSACTRNVKLLDIGGFAVTLYRIASDAKFISEVKRDFLKNELHDRIVGSEYDFMEGI